MTLFPRLSGPDKQASNDGVLWISTLGPKAKGAWPKHFLNSAFRLFLKLRCITLVWHRFESLSHINAAFEYEAQGKHKHERSDEQVRKQRS